MATIAFSSTYTGQYRLPSRLLYGLLTDEVSRSAGSLLSAKANEALGEVGQGLKVVVPRSLVLD